jgi:hypothetical protein
MGRCDLIINIFNLIKKGKEMTKPSWSSSQSYKRASGNVILHSSRQKLNEQAQVEPKLFLNL